MTVHAAVIITCQIFLLPHLSAYHSSPTQHNTVTYIRDVYNVRLNLYNFQNVEYSTVLDYAISEFRMNVVGGMCVLVIV